MRSAASQNCATELVRYCRLFRRPPGDGDVLLLAQGGVEIQPDAGELRRPGGERIALARIEHVAHRQRELVQVVLNAQELQRVPAVPIGELGLQPPQARDLPRDVPRVGDDRRQRDEQAQQQGQGRRPARGVRVHHRGTIIIASLPRSAVRSVSLRLPLPASRSFRLPALWQLRTCRRTSRTALLAPRTSA